MRNYLLTLSLFCWLLSGCSQNNLIKTVRWSGGEPLPEPPKSYSKTQKEFQTQKYKIEFESQLIDGVEIEDSFYKKIIKKSKSSDVEFIAFSWLENLPLSIRKDLMLMKLKEDSFLKFLNSKTEYKQMKLIQKPNYVLRTTPEFVLLRKSVFESNKGYVYEIFWDKNFQLVSQKTIGLHFADGDAQIFPDGPMKSEISAVILKNLEGTGKLASPKIKITTQSDKSILSPSHQFIFDPEDSRFKQVQVYYYLAKSLSWFESQFKFKIPFQLEAETSIGFPEKTNAAFYFNRKIRLGEGDGEVFQKLELDPSIVIHESVHSIIDVVAKLSSEGEGGSINEGLSDFFTCIQLNSPLLGEASYLKAKYKRSIDTDLNYTDRKGGLYHDSGIVSGLFWEISKETTANDAQKIAWDVLVRLNPKTNFESFKLEVIDVIKSLSPELQQKINPILKKRKWVI